MQADRLGGNESQRRFSSQPVQHNPAEMFQMIMDEEGTEGIQTVQQPAKRKETHCSFGVEHNYSLVRFLIAKSSDEGEFDLIVNGSCSARLFKSFPLTQQESVCLGELTNEQVTSRGWPLEARIPINPGECIELINTRGLGGESCSPLVAADRTCVIAKAALGQAQPRKLYSQYFGLRS